MNMPHFLRALSLAVLTVLLGGTGCEMHPPSETIKGYSEKETIQQAIDKQKSMVPEGANTNAPAYFPEKNP
jgi:hypothetical protein